VDEAETRKKMLSLLSGECSAEAAAERQRLLSEYETQILKKRVALLNSALRKLLHISLKVAADERNYGHPSAHHRS
jgi:vacuolar-type H+-ATPase subunit H